MAKSDLGTKRICPTTGKKFYDLNKNPVISPYTGEIVPIAPVAQPRVRGEAARAAAASAAAAEATPEPAEAEELVSLEEADAEETPARSRLSFPSSKMISKSTRPSKTMTTTISTFIADEEEGDEDVTDIIGDVGGDEETRDQPRIVIRVLYRAPPRTRGELTGKAETGFPTGSCSDDKLWGHSSAGRALAWHARGRRFDPAWLHQPSLASQATARQARTGLT